MIGFIVLRHVMSELTNKYWNESYRTIRRFYPNEIIMIIDDNSNPEYLKTEEDIVLTNCFIVQSEFPGAAEILPYYYYLKYKLFDKAVIIHDSVFFRKWLDFDKATDKGCPIWHFHHHHCDGALDVMGLLRVMDNSDELVALYEKKQLWKGCFGAQSVVAHDFLSSLEEKHHLTRLVPFMTDRDKRSTLERVISCLFASGNNELQKSPSMLGVIYDYIQWGIPYHVYQEQKGTILKQDLIKVWTTR